jgi:hypothetical protein
VRAFLRTVPSPTSLHPSVPASVRGIAITDSAGPFLTPLGNPIWIDAFNVVQLTPVTRHTDLVGLFPVDPTRSTPRKIVRWQRLVSGSLASREQPSQFVYWIPY